jgi:hypothetical protein
LPLAFLTAVLRVVGRKSYLVIGAMATLFLVVTGPFQTHLSLGPLGLPIYWAGIVFASQFVAVAIILALRARDLDLGPFGESLLGAAGMAVIYAPPAYLWTWALVTPVGREIMDFHWFVINVLIISSFVFAAREIILHHLTQNLFAQGESGALSAGALHPVVPPRLMARLPQDDPGPVRRIEAVDHFVAVTTPRTTHHLRLRFADAVAEMDGAAGLVTHRSHWVRRDQITCLEKEKGRVFARLSCGTRIPVSRTYRPLVEAALASGARGAVKDRVI